MRVFGPPENQLKENIVFFCKDCEKIVQVFPVGRKFVYRCRICNTKNVAFGTDKSIRNFYRIKETGADSKPAPDAAKEEKKDPSASK